MLLDGVDEWWTGKRNEGAKRSSKIIDLDIVSYALKMGVTHVFVSYFGS